GMPWLWQEKNFMQKYSHHILTVGISLLTNFGRARNQPITEAARYSGAIAEFLGNDPAKACAEINSLHSRTGFLSRKTPELHVTLVFTSTDSGKLCASLIEKELKRHKVAVHKLPIRGLNAPARDLTPEFAARESAESLADLRQRIIDHVARLQKAIPPPVIELNITGGYKAECAVVYELGRALRLPVYYLHETFKVSVLLP
ncbi:MAG TPA: putative CRISPR-associated protein, partial [Verrucomicrobiae bacterium]|nr:putative CRISPR-associated protein [Verrucomicrobiae bacterium]